MLLLVASAFTLSGCSSVSDAWADTLAGWWKTKRTDVEAIPLVPNARYLRATVSGVPFLLALGATEKYTDPATGRVSTTEVWFSGDGEVLRLVDGRVAGTSGIRLVDWRHVELRSAPAWATMTGQSSSSGGQYSRLRDVMPGYRSGVMDQVSIRAMDGAPWRTRLVQLDPSSLRWYQETASTTGGAAEDRLPASRFAVDPANGSVVYSEQCLSADFCMTLQQWPVTSSNTNNDKQKTASVGERG